MSLYSLLPYPERLVPTHYQWLRRSLGNRDMYAHVMSSEPLTVLSPRQCRTHPAMAPQAMSTAGSGCPHDVRQRVIRRQGGRLPRRTVQCVRVRLGASDTPCRETAWLKIRDSSIIAPVNLSRCPQRRSVAMRCQLLHRERGLADSAGHTQTWPPNLCLPPPQEVRMMYASA